MNEPQQSLLNIFSLTNTGARTHEDIFTGTSHWMPSGRVFGGQVLAQSVIAANHTVEPERHIHSMHGYFLRPGDVTKTITFAVDRIHDGRSFSARRTQAYQDGLPILSMIASYQTDDIGLEYQVEMPHDLPEPEDLPTAAETLDSDKYPAAQAWAHRRPFDIRHIPSPIYVTVDGPRVAHQAVWFRALAPLPDDPGTHRAALAYASDYSIIEPIMRRHGISWVTPGMRAASLDHAMWWHRPARADEWLLYTQEASSSSGGRGLAHGQIFSRDGRLVASVAQEAMLRLRAGDDTVSDPS